MTTIQELDSLGYIVENNYIRDLTYRSYLEDYGEDRTTSPNGTTGRIHIREIDVVLYQLTGQEFYITDREYDDLDQDDRENYQYYGHATKYEIWSWGTGGNNPYKLDSFDTREEAELEYYAYLKDYALNKNCDAPTFRDSYEDALEELAEDLDKPIPVIDRWLRLKNFAKAKQLMIKEQEQKAYRERKEGVAQLAQAEAQKMVIDQQFKDAIAWADEVHGAEKNNRHASAMKGLLERNGIEKVQSDFWQVFRILKAKVTARVGV